jgi:hypothetical protein
VIEDMGLQLLYRGPLEWHYFRTKFHENLPSGSEVISGGQKDGQTGDLQSLLLFLESRLEMKVCSLDHLITCNRQGNMCAVYSPIILQWGGIPGHVLNPDTLNVIVIFT